MKKHWLRFLSPESGRQRGRDKTPSNDRGFWLTQKKGGEEGNISSEEAIYEGGSAAGYGSGFKLDKKVSQDLHPKRSGRKGVHLEKNEGKKKGRSNSAVHAERGKREKHRCFHL